MFGRLVRKELLQYLLDFRFVVVFALCVFLAALSVYVGTRNYALELREYHAVEETNRRALQSWLDEGNWEFLAKGYKWNRRPEALSPMVYGLSGKLGQEVVIQAMRLPEFEGSLFETDPVHALFKVLDLAFLVKVVLSLFVLLFTYDAVCGEKEAGTLRLYASFPVARSRVALAKVVGSTLAVMVPFLVVFVLACAVLALSPHLDLSLQSWMRLIALLGVFLLYLGVFAVFGLWASALTHRRMTSFLGLLGLWTVWVFVVPNLAVRAAQVFAPETSVYEMEKELGAFRWEIRGEQRRETRAYWEGLGQLDWEALPDAEKQGYLDGHREIVAKWEAAYLSRAMQIQAGRRNRVRDQRRLASVLSALSPVGAVSYASMDLCRTGFEQQEQIENALNAHLNYLTTYVREKYTTVSGGRAVLTDFSPFVFRDTDTAGACLSRNVVYILNLALLAVLGFAGAYVAILRYDVR